MRESALGSATGSASPVMNRKLTRAVAFFGIGFFWVAPVAIAVCVGVAKIAPPEVAVAIALALYAAEGMFWATREPKHFARRKRRRLTRRCS